MLWLVLAALSLLVSGPVLALKNGLALTPPMGWLTWERFRCNTDCVNDPHNCVGEWLIRNMTDMMVSKGYKDAGYEYVIIDDCWLAKDRASDGQLQPDATRFPSGMKALADYIHSKGLKFGIYEDFGIHTCAGFPGSEYYMQMDAQTFADWGVDYLKLDGCNAPTYKEGYPPVAFFLQKTGRDIVLSCEYPAYQHTSNYQMVADACNMARNYKDIQDSWASVASYVEFYGTDSDDFSAVVGPGYWNDPDEMIIGNFGLSYEQERVQMGMWAIWSSPLIMSVDLRNIRASASDLYLNKYVIAINQDKLGRQGTRKLKNGVSEVWTKPMSDNSTAFALLNMGATMPMKVAFNFSDLGMKNAAGYKVMEVFSNVAVGTFKPADKFAANVNPSGIFLGHAMPV